jgi:hypothetical protein
MSSILADAPTLKISPNELGNLIHFIYSNEKLLKYYGAFKIQLNSECELGLKKRKVSVSSTNIQQVTKINPTELIYSVQSNEDYNKLNKELTPLQRTDERLFWSNLSCDNNDHKESRLSILHEKSFFYQKINRKMFDIHCLPKQSLLKLGGNQLLNQFVPSLIRAHEPGAIIPLNSTEKHLCSFIYHHFGGPRHWYIIPYDQRKDLETITLKENSLNCLDHNQLLIDPSFFDKYNIRYHRIIQYPTEIVILSSGALSQSFFQDASWNEKIDFALPSWIGEGHAFHSCQCHIVHKKLPYQFNMDLFQHKHIQKYINTNFNGIVQKQLSVIQGFIFLKKIILSSGFFRFK